MDHLDYQIMIQKHIDGCLPPAQRLQLQQHLAACPECMQTYRELTALDALLAAELTHVSAPADFAAGVMQALPATYAAPQTTAKRRPRWRAWAGVGVAAALLLVAGLSGLLDQLSGQPSLTQPPPLAQTEPEQVQLALPDLPIVAENEPQPQQLPDPAEIEAADDPAPHVANTPDSSAVADTPAVAAPDPADALQLPAVATTSQASGAYAMITLAAVSGCDALRPQVSGDIVTFYVELDGDYLEWQVAADGSGQAVFAGQSEDLPALSGAGRWESDGNGLEWYAATSPDGVYTAHNRSDGLYINEQQLATPGGGYLLGWAADSSKLFFSDASGRLWLYYPAEDLLLDVVGGVSSATWNGSNNIVLSAYDSSSGFYSVFRVSVP